MGSISGVAIHRPGKASSVYRRSSGYLHVCYNVCRIVGWVAQQQIRENLFLYSVAPWYIKLSKPRLLQ